MLHQGLRVQWYRSSWICERLQDPIQSQSTFGAPEKTVPWRAPCPSATNPGEQLKASLMKILRPMFRLLGHLIGVKRQKYLHARFFFFFGCAIWNPMGIFFGHQVILLVRENYYNGA
jgi:hypothetical protein